MIPDCDIWLSARAMIQRYGSNAVMEAAERADEHLEKGDAAGSTVWQRIMKAIEELQKPIPGTKEAVHW